MANREGLKNKLVSFGNAQMSPGQNFSDVCVLNITDALSICMRENTSESPIHIFGMRIGIFLFL